MLWNQSIEALFIFKDLKEFIFLKNFIYLVTVVPFFFISVHPVCLSFVSTMSKNMHLLYNECAVHQCDLILVCICTTSVHLTLIFISRFLYFCSVRISRGSLSQLKLGSEENNSPDWVNVTTWLIDGEQPLLSQCEEAGCWFLVWF